ncbi:cytochrome bd oxidase small subunit CydS [Paenibacillus woosongensis]
MEHFLMMRAPQLVLIAAVVFLFVYAYRYKDPTD